MKTKLTSKLINIKKILKEFNLYEDYEDNLDGFEDLISKFEDIDTSNIESDDDLDDFINQIEDLSKEASKLKKKR